jgi:hypothetical protein
MGSNEIGREPSEAAALRSNAAQGKGKTDVLKTAGMGPRLRGSMLGAEGCSGQVRVVVSLRELI